MQPALGIFINVIHPYFTHNIGFWIGVFHYLTKLTPKFIVVNICGNIQTPTIDSKINPILSEIEDKATHLGLSVFNLGNSLNPHQAL